MKALIAHTAPDDIIPSKNQLVHNGVLKSSWDGENIHKDKNQPPWNEKHMGQDIKPEIKPLTGDINGISKLPILLTPSLKSLKIELNTIIFINP
jgi:hypothetical protein